jgi:hypothetical protein
VIAVGPVVGDEYKIGIPVDQLATQRRRHGGSIKLDLVTQ